MSRTNPWGVTDGEARALDAVIEHGCQKAAARELHLSLRTIEAHLSRARNRMGLDGRIKPLIEWDRFRRAAG
ncbi:MAG: hypothetical protein AB9M53_00660 [Leptothrix sp. (in: b-proteobacteria)]